MGCDIHTRVEYFTTVNGEQAWFDGDHYVRNKYFDGKDEWEDELTVVDIYNGRNYALFSTLAGVRNYGDTEIIDEPRGIPSDANKFIKADYERWGCDAHTPSWFTLKELIDYQEAEPVVKYSGMISPEASVNLDNGIYPEEWCQGTSIKTYIRREWEEKSEVLVPLIDSLKARCKELFYLWDDERVLEFVNKIRVVFWFDN